MSDRVFLAPLMALVAWAFLMTGPAQAQSGVARDHRPVLEFLAPKGKSFALLIANEDYKGDEKYKLKFPIKDVQKIGRALEEHHGFKVQIEKNVTSAHLESIIKEFFQKYGKDREARLFLWFAGHGTQIANASGVQQSYLLPVDLHLKDDHAFMERYREQVEAKGLKVHRIAEYIDDFVRARQVLVVIDSCFAGAIFDDSPRRAAPQVDVPIPRERWANPVRYVIAAGTAKQQVYDDGHFADHFVLAITGRSPSLARLHREYVTARELGNHLLDVISYRRPDGQRPRHRSIGHSVEQEGEFVFELPGKPIPPPPTSPPKLAGLQTSANATLDTMAERCMTWWRKKHPLANDIAAQVAEALSPRNGEVVHTFDPGQLDHTGQLVITTPDDIESVLPDGSFVRVRYARKDDNANFGNLVLIPIVPAGAATAEPGQFLLRGAWSRHGSGFGCVEIGMNTKTGRGTGRFYPGYRNRFDLDVRGVTRKALTSTLAFPAIGK